VPTPAVAYAGLRRIGANCQTRWRRWGWRGSPKKENLILLTDRPPQLETPLHYFRQDLTPNSAFFVRWHLSGLPTSVDLRTVRLNVAGHVKTPLSLSFHELTTRFPTVSMVAVNQCSGNSRSYYDPPVPGGQWKHGAMGNARWTGVRLRDLLDAAGVRAGAVQVVAHGLDRPPLTSTPLFEKSLAIDHARDGEVMVAYAMNDEPLRWSRVPPSDSSCRGGMAPTG